MTTRSEVEKAIDKLTETEPPINVGGYTPLSRITPDGVSVVILFASNGVAKEFFDWARNSPSHGDTYTVATLRRELVTVVYNVPTEHEADMRAKRDYESFMRWRRETR